MSVVRRGRRRRRRFAVWEAVAHFWHAARLLDGMPKTDELRAIHLRIVLSLIDAATSTSEAGDFWNNDGEREAASDTSTRRWPSPPPRVR